MDPDEDACAGDDGDDCNSTDGGGGGGGQSVDQSGWTGSWQSYFFSAEYNGPAPTAGIIEAYQMHCFVGAIYIFAIGIRKRVGFARDHSGLSTLELR